VITGGLAGLSGRDLRRRGLSAQSTATRVRGSGSESRPQNRIRVSAICELLLTRVRRHATVALEITIGIVAIPAQCRPLLRESWVHDATAARFHSDRCQMPGKTASNRSFGLLIAVALAIIAGSYYWARNSDYVYWLIAAAFFLMVALLMPRLLYPLKRLWLRLGGMLNSIVSPVVLGLVYVLAFVVTGSIIRFFGKDLLKLKRDPTVSSYWIKRNPPGPLPESLKDQF
jgi:hypothetical protein